MRKGKKWTYWYAIPEQYHKGNIMEEKTNVMRILDQKKIKYTAHSYADTDALSGMEVATALSQNPDAVFKTLVTIGKSANHYVFLVPVNQELDLKKAAKSVGEKSIEMIKSKELLRDLISRDGEGSSAFSRKVHALSQESPAEAQVERRIGFL